MGTAAVADEDCCAATESDASESAVDGSDAGFWVATGVVLVGWRVVLSDGGALVGVADLGMIPGPAVAVVVFRLCVEAVAVSYGGRMLDDKQSVLEGGTGE